MSELGRTLRTLGRQPAFTLAAVLTLGLGIGANTTVFSLVSAVHLRPLPFPEPERLVGVHETSATQVCAGCAVGTSYPGFLDWRESARSFESMAAYGEQAGVISGDGEPERVGVGVVSKEFFTVLNARAVRGRAVTASDDVPGGPRVVVLSDWLWMSRYGGDPGVLGRTIRLNGVPHEVVGIMPPWVRIPEFADLWVALAPTVEHQSRSVRDYSVVARLAPGVTTAAAAGEMRGIAQSLSLAYPVELSEWSATVSSLRDDLGGDTGPFFWLLLGAVGLVLLVACANLSGLLLARAAARERELAMRAALGAGRFLLIRHLLKEAFILGGLGGGLGLVLSLWGVELVRALLPENQIPHWIQVELDARVLVFCAAVTIGTGLLFGILPSLRYSRPDLVEALKQTSATFAGGGRQRLRSGLVVVQTALALVLLSGAGVLGKTYLRLTTPTGTTGGDDVILGDLTLAHERYADVGQVVETVEVILERLGRFPGREAAVGRFVFVAGFGPRDETISVEGLDQVPAAGSPRFIWKVTPRYLTVHGVSLNSGRDIAASDGPGNEPVVVVNEQMARTLWPDGTALGRRIRLGGAASGAPWRTVIGVAANSEPPGRPGRPVQAAAYVPLAQGAGEAGTSGPLQLVARSVEPFGSVARAIRQAVNDVDPDMPDPNIRTAAQDRTQMFWFVSFFATLLGAFAAFAVLLAAMGLYGIVAFQVVERRREIGLRAALGARRSEVLRSIVTRGLRLAAVGVAAGLVLSAVFNRMLGSILFGTSPVDPVVLAGVALTLVSVTVAASLIPAWRATTVDPMEALRHE